MNYLSINQLTKSFDGINLFENISLTLNKGDKIAIVGRNGSGKSTLAKIIVDEESYDSGQVFKRAQLKIGYFAQHHFLDTDKTVYQAMLEVFEQQLQVKKQLDTLYQSYIENKNDVLLNQYNDLLLHYEDIGGYTYIYRIETILNRFGFKAYYDHPVHQLSGGEKTRLALAKLLLEEPDVLVLDEPTNHLDVETIEFLESFLKAYKNSVILISHDRFFINQIVDQVFELEFKRGILYKGNYDYYLVEKEKQYERLLKDYEIQQQLIEKEEAFIEKNIARASTTKRAQARRKRLEKMQVMDRPQIDNRQMNLTFNVERTSGKLVTNIQQLTIGYDEPLYQDIQFDIRRNEKVAIIGPNGVGKSTLLKTIYGLIPPLDGIIRYGTGVTPAYFDQEIAKVNSNKTVIDEIWDENRTLLENDVRSLLAQFLFTGDDVFKIVNDLSGGEKVRLSLVKLFLERANFLILDEVTNHLDIKSKEVLEEALIDYDGTLLFVSHDRYFINRVATKIVELTPDGIEIYDGNYHYYLEKKKEKQELVDKFEKEVNLDYETAKKIRNQIRKLEREQAEIEASIESLEATIEELKQSQFDKAVYLDVQKAHEVQQAIDDLEEEHLELLEKWDAIHEELDQLKVDVNQS